MFVKRLHEIGRGDMEIGRGDMEDIFYPTPVLSSSYLRTYTNHISLQCQSMASDVFVFPLSRLTYGGCHSVSKGSICICCTYMVHVICCIYMVYVICCIYYVSQK